MTIDDPNSGGLIRAVSELCQRSEYFDASHPTPRTYDEYAATPILAGRARYSRAQLETALSAYIAAKTARTAQQGIKDAKKAALFLDLKTRLATDLNIQVETPADLAGKIEGIIPATRLKRDGKATMAERITEMEKQVEILTMFVALLSRQ